MLAQDATGLLVHTNPHVSVCFAGNILRQKTDVSCCLQNAEGTGLGPFDCWLLLRGIKTMSLRMDRQIANCAKLADFLQSHPLVKKINYPGLHQHPRSSVQLRQAQNGGSLLSFETGRFVFFPVQLANPVGRDKLLCDARRSFWLCKLFKGVGQEE